MKLNWCDGKSVAKVLHCRTAKKTFPQYAEDEHQGIRGIRNQYVGKQGMGMMTAVAD